MSSTFPLNEKDIEKKFIESKIYSTKKAYCFMFVNQFYSLHLEAINLLTNVLKDGLFKLSKIVLTDDETDRLMRKN